MGLSASGYYAWFKREPSKRQKENDDLKYRISSIFKISRGTYGRPRIHDELNKNGYKCSPGKVKRLMDELGIKVKKKRLYKVTTDSNHILPVAPNLLNRKFKPGAENEVWASDISYIDTGEGWLYLAVVIDLFSRRVIGWSMQNHMRKSLVIDALDMAIKSRHIKPGLIHHSDRGSQYCSHRYQEKLTINGLVPSMSRRGDCWDNAVVESFFASLKKDLVHRQRFETRADAKINIFEYIEVFYNRIRSHSTLGYLSPVRYEEYARTA